MSIAGGGEGALEWLFIGQKNNQQTKHCFLLAYMSKSLTDSFFSKYQNCRYINLEGLNN